MSLPAGIDRKRLRRLIELAREEDLGSRGDLTSHIAGLSGKAAARIVARRPCVVAGLAIAPEILRAFDAKLSLRGKLGRDGQRFDAPDAVLGEIDGPAGALLACERTLLNFLQRMSGVATLTRRFVDAVAGTGAKIYDTRKTVPGWRDLDKYAVRCGGGCNHRMGLHDAVLIKDNHLADIPGQRLAAAVREMLNRAAELAPPPAFVEVEVDTPQQLDELLKVVGIDVILLDNFTPQQMRQAVARRDELGLGGKMELEASGGIDLGSARRVAETGIYRISVGALTHSAPAVDISLEVSDWAA